MKHKIMVSENKQKPLFQRNALFAKIWKAKYIYLLLLPFLAWLLVICYVPMAGLILAFKEYRIGESWWSMEWVGLQHFERLFATPVAIKSIITSITLSLQRIFWEFPVPILLAILLSEMCGKRIKKICQTVLTFPHFISWVMLASLINSLFSSSGIVNQILESMGVGQIGFLTDTGFFRSMLFITSNWKEMGWSAIIYMATIAGIDPTLYEAAEVDGAGRLRRIWHITLAGLKPLIALKLVMSMSGLLGGGFDQIFNLQNGIVADSVRILDVYIYDITFNGLPNYGFSTAVGLFKGVIGFILLMGANKLSGIISGEQMYSFEKREKTKKFAREGDKRNEGIEEKRKE